MNNLLPHSYCINLASRPERWVRAQQQFASIGLTNVQRFEAVPPPIIRGKQAKGWVGCMLSHIAVLQKAPRNAGPIGIFEDDVDFVNLRAVTLSNVTLSEVEGCSDGIKMTSLIKNALDQLHNTNWHMLYLGGNPTMPLLPHSENLLRVPGGLLTTHAMIYNSDSEIIDFILKHENKGTRIDDFLMQVIQPKFNVFITYPIIATQHDGQSDVTGTENKYHDLIIENYWKNVPRRDAIYRV